MRAVGIDEHYITGDAPEREKFQKFAETLPHCVGNPIYHWSHLELSRYFGCDTVLNGESAQQVWDVTMDKLQSDELSVRGIIAGSRVQAIGTTDDPADDLQHHKALKDDTSLNVKVTPTFRPDKAININKSGYLVYLDKLGAAAGIKITTLDDLKEALVKRIDFFDSLGCKASDHGLDYIAFRTVNTTALNSIFQKALSGAIVEGEEAEAFKTCMMLFFGREFSKRGWVMQLHYGAMRSTNTAMFERLGPDTGYDAISSYECSRAAAEFLDALEFDNRLPKTILYSLNPNDNTMLASIAGCFQGPGTFGKVQHGSAWWFNDTKLGMEQQMLSLANVGALGTFIGMLTDSRSFLSYTRHEYFRRILCNLLADLVINGEFPNDTALLAQLVQNISYRNCARYFGYEVLA
jgi:glucuronate isomerase